MSLRVGDSHHLLQEALRIGSEREGVCQAGNDIWRWRWLTGPIFRVAIAEPVRLDRCQGVREQEWEYEQGGGSGGEIFARAGHRKHARGIYKREQPHGVLPLRDVKTRVRNRRLLSSAAGQ